MANDLTPELEHRYNEDLRATLRRTGLLRAERKECSKILGEVIKEEESRAGVLLDLLDGRISEQVALPGIEEQSERSRSIGAILRRAIETAQSISGVEAEPAGPVNEAAEVLGKARGPLGRKLRKGGGRG